MRNLSVIQLHSPLCALRPFVAISLAREVLGPWSAEHTPPGYFTGQHFSF